MLPPNYFSIPHLENERVSTMISPWHLKSNCLSEIQGQRRGGNNNQQSADLLSTYTSQVDKQLAYTRTTFIHVSIVSPKDISLSQFNSYLRWGITAMLEECAAQVQVSPEDNT